MRRALALTEDQMRLVERAARGLAVEARDGFLKTVADHLNGDPSDAAVNAAVNIALDRLVLFVWRRRTEQRGPRSPLICRKEAKP